MMGQHRIIKIWVLALVCLMVSSGTVWGQGIKERMKQRLPVIADLKARGIIGETNKGYLGYVGDAREKQTVIAAENKDRKAIYAYFAKQQKTTLAVVEQIQAKRKAEKANSGEYIQTADGKWVKK